MSRVALLAVLACACRDEQPDRAPTIEVASYATMSSNKLDVLFQIDNSESVSDLQVNLAAAAPVLFERIADLDLHIGVITSDLGTSGSIGEPAPMIGSCADRGDDGALKTTGAPVLGMFLVDENDGIGGRRKNYTGDLAAVFSQMVRVGSGGCAFEQPFAATRRALTSPTNTGFSRNDANLLVVMMMDEDDCSVIDPAIFGPESTELGPLSTSYRCSVFGLECDQPMAELGVKTNCHPRAASPYVEDISPFVDAIRIVRGDPSRVAVAAIAGPADMVEIEGRAPPGGGTAIPVLAHSCDWQGPDGLNAANPAVRLAHAIDALAPNSSFSPICSTDLAPAMLDAARNANALRGVICLDPARVGENPECSVTLESFDGEVPLSLCPATGDCFEIVSDAACGDRPRLVVHVASPMENQYVRARCVAL